MLSLTGGSDHEGQVLADTDTVYIELYAAEIDETRDLGEDTLLELDATGRLCALTIEHASDCMDIPAFSYEQIPGSFNGF